MEDRAGDERPRRDVRLRAAVAFGTLIALQAIGPVAHAATPALTGTFYGDDNGVYYFQQIGDQVWWAGESVDPDPNPHGGLLGPGHVWSHGLDSTSVFRGTVSGSILSGKWVELTRGANLGTGSVDFAIEIVTDNAGTHTRLDLLGGTFRATEFTPGDPIDDAVYQYPDGHFETLTFYSRFQQAKKSIAASANKETGDKLGDTHNPEELRPYRDQTVFYGEFVTRKPFSDEVPHINMPPDASRDYANFACNINDGDLDLRIQGDIDRLPTDFPSSTLANGDSGFGWGNVNATDEGENGYDHRDILPKLLNIGLTDPTAASAEQISVPGNHFYIAAEGVMYAGNQDTDQVIHVDGNTFFHCPSSAPLLFPGWAAMGGNSILVNSRPVNQHFTQNFGPCRPLAGPGQTGLAALAGQPLRAADPTNPDDACKVAEGYGTQVRVTGALILDCGHSDISDTDTNYFTPTDALHTCDQGEGWTRTLVCPPHQACFLDSGETDEGDDQNQEIHPFYSLDIVQCPLGNYPSDACPGKSIRPNLTGAWGSDDGGTYFVRQTGNTIWWLGLRRNRDPIMPGPAVQIANPTNVFEGTLSVQADGSALISGQAVTVPKGLASGGETTTATFTVNANHKQFQLTSLSGNDPGFPFPSKFDKLYEPQEDQTPPSSTLTIGTPRYQASAAAPLYATNHTPFTIKGDDGDTGQGVLTFWYRSFHLGLTSLPLFTPVVLDQPIAMAQTSFTIGGPDGPTIVETFATDASGNDEAFHIQNLALDDSAPAVAFTQPTASSYTHADVITLDYTVSDAGTGVASFTPTLDGASKTPVGGSLASAQTIDLLNDGIGLGPHTFAVTATDNIGNAGTQSIVFTLIVTPASIAADVSKFLAAGKIKNKGVANALSSKLNDAAAARAAGDCATASADYRAFINQVNAQAGKGIDAVAASTMIADANYLIAHCP